MDAKKVDRPQSLDALEGPRLGSHGSSIALLETLVRPDGDYEYQQILSLDPSQKVIYSVDLPAEIGMTAPRPNHLESREFERIQTEKGSRELLGDIPRLELTSGQELSFRLASLSSSNGSLGEAGVGNECYIAPVHTEEGERVCCIKLWAEFSEYEENETVLAHVFGKLGVGPRVFGLIEYQGRMGLVMEPISGDFATRQAPTDETFRDLRDIIERLIHHRIQCKDFQWFVTTEGRAIVIDAGSARISPSEDPDSIRPYYEEDFQSWYEPLLLERAQLRSGELSYSVELWKLLQDHGKGPIPVQAFSEHSSNDTISIFTKF